MVILLILIKFLFKKIVDIPVIFSVIGLIALNCNNSTLKIRENEYQQFRKIPIPEQFRSHGAVVLLDSGYMEIKATEKINYSTLYRTRVIKIQNKSGYSYSNGIIPYSKFNKVNIRTAFTIAPDGKITRINPDEIYDITMYPEFVFYSDQKAKIFTFPDVMPGSILVMHYEIGYSYITASTGWIFQQKIPVLSSIFSIGYPSALILKYKNYSDVEPVEDYKAPAGFQNFVKWKMTNVEPYIEEPNSPPAKAIQKRIEFAPAGMVQWNDVASWYSALFYPRVKDSEESNQLLKEALTSGPEDTLKAVYDFIRNSIRYMAVELGIGGFQPHLPEVVSLRKYGDCKDMVVLAYTWFKKLGITAYPVLIPFRTYHEVDTSLASPFYFNHLILAIPHTGDSLTFLDFTAKHCSFGSIPWYLQGQWGLKIDQEGQGELVRIPAQSTNKNFIIDSVKIYLRSDTIRLQRTIVLQGNPLEDIKQLVMNKELDEKKILIKQYFRDQWPDIRISELVVPDNIDILPKAEITMTGSLEPVSKNGQKMVLLEPASVLYSRPDQIFREEHRKSPMLFKYLYEFKANISIRFGDNWRLANKISEYNVEKSFGKLNVTCFVSKDSCSINIMNTNRVLKIPQKQLNDYQMLLKKLKLFHQDKIIFEKTEPDSGQINQVTDHTQSYN